MKRIIILVLILNPLYLGAKPTLTSHIEDDLKGVVPYLSSINLIAVAGPSGLLLSDDRYNLQLKLGLSLSNLQYTLMEFGWSFAINLNNRSEGYYFNLTTFLGIGYRIFPSVNFVYVPELIIEAGMTFIDYKTKDSFYSDVVLNLIFRNNFFLYNQWFRIFYDVGLEKKDWDNKDFGVIAGLGVIFSFDLNHSLLKKEKRAYSNYMSQAFDRIKENALGS